MKIVIVIFCLTASFVSRAQFSELKKDTTLNYYFRALIANGLGKEDSITIKVDRTLVDSLNLKATDLYIIAMTASQKAKQSLKEPISYETFPAGKYIILLSDARAAKPAQIMVTWDYIGQNAYGAKKSNNALFFFDLKGNYQSGVF